MVKRDDSSRPRGANLFRVRRRRERARESDIAGEAASADWQTFAHEADVGVRGRGATLAEAFVGAATALTAVICDPTRVRPAEAVAIGCEAPDSAQLLVDWLNALVYEMATRHMLFSRFTVQTDGRRLSATAWGELVDGARHRPAAEVKAASYCELAVRREDDGSWLAQCVVDV